MIKAFAPRESGGYSRVLLSIFLVGVLPLSACSQGKTAVPRRRVLRPRPHLPKPARNRAEPAAAAPKAEPPTPLVETYVDPRAQKCLENTFPVLGKRAPERGPSTR